MIDTLSLENFKRHTRTNFALQPFSVLVGPNGAGKTSVLEALHALSLLHTQAFDEVFSGTRAPSRVGRRTPDVASFTIRATGHAADSSRTLSLHVERSKPDEARLTEAWRGPVELVAAVEGPSAPLRRDVPLRDQGFDGYWPEMHNCALLRVDPRQVSAPSDKQSDTVNHDGAQLVATLAYLKFADEVSFEQLTTDLRLFVPEIRRITASHKAGARQGYELAFDTDCGTSIWASDMSDGTLILLTLLTVIHSPKRPRLLLIDGLENALHPTAQMELTKFLRKLVDSDRSIQIVATTHSPFVVDCMPQESVLVFAKADDGTTGVRPLTEHPEAVRFRGKLSSGQIWTLDDEEDWVLGGAK